MVGLFVGTAFGLGPIRDSMTLRSADPAMKALALAAGLNHNGELVFLRTHPQLDSIAQMMTDCPNKSSKDGYVEQGCFDPASNRINIRDMPNDLKKVEIVTAAHEMLHAAYAQDSSSQRQSIDKKVERQLPAVQDSALHSRLSEYAKLEPGARDNELHSILGTEYGQLQPALTAYYGQYFTDRSNVVAANTAVDSLFKNDKNQIVSAENSINQNETAAKSLYSQSVAAGRSGNAGADDYYYNQYNAKIDTINRQIDHYNQLITQYNTFASEYDGHPISQIQNVQTEHS